MQEELKEDTVYYVAFLHLKIIVGMRILLILHTGFHLFVSIFWDIGSSHFGNQYRLETFSLSWDAWKATKFSSVGISEVHKPETWDQRMGFISLNELSTFILQVGVQLFFYNRKPIGTGGNILCFSVQMTWHRGNMTNIIPLDFSLR